jgi:hypothetical protein
MVLAWLLARVELALFPAQASDYDLFQFRRQPTDGMDLPLRIVVERGPPRSNSGVGCFERAEERLDFLRNEEQLTVCGKGSRAARSEMIYRLNLAGDRGRQ